MPSARRTETVQLIERCLPTVITILAEVPGKDGKLEQRIGSGSIIHSAGFALTNDHVIRNLRGGGALLSNGRLVGLRVIARFVHEDLAIVQVRTDAPLPTIKLGRSHDVVLGEPTLVIGSPGGLVHSVSTGIVSGVNRSTHNESNFLPWMIQTNAAVNRGNSGGPLINALGEQIGVMSTIGNDLQNVSFAIAIDHVREALPAMLSIEQRSNFWLGVDCDPLTEGAVVSRIEADSPAAMAGLQPGDRLTKLGEFDLINGVDLQLALVGRQRGDQLPLHYVREGQTHMAQLVLSTLPLPKPVADEGLEPGLQFEIYRGDWTELPDFNALTAERTGHCEAVDLAAISAPVEQVGIRWTGFIRIPRDDLYAFYTTSDDGSRLWIGDRLLVDNDGLHPARETGGLIRLPAGLHPLRLEYFERGGAEHLSIAWEGSNLPKELVPAAALLAPATGSPAPQLERAE